MFFWLCPVSCLSLALVCVQTFWNFKLKVFNYSRNCSVQATLIPNLHTYLLSLRRKIDHSAVQCHTWRASALHCNANVFTRNHLDLWGVISQTSTIGVGQWQMHLSTSRRPPPKATWWSNGIHSKLTWKMTSLSNLEPMCRYHLTCFDIYTNPTTII